METVSRRLRTKPAIQTADGASTRRRLEKSRRPTARGAVADTLPGSVLAAAPRWLLVTTLVALPWAWGGTAPWTTGGLALVTGLIGLLWLADAVVRGRALRVDRLTLGCAGWLLAQGWLMTLNPHYVHDAATWRFSTAASWWPGGPGSVDRAASTAAMWRCTALLIWLIVITDVAQDGRWRRRLRWSLVLAASALVLFGLVQRALRAPAIFWQGEPGTSPFFATFFYAPNAGAFINLAFPLAVGLALVACWSGAGPTRAGWGRSLALLSVCIFIAGAGVNASRAALAVLIFSMLVLAAWAGWRWARTRPAWPRGEALSVGAGLLALALIVGSVGTEVVQQKWALLPAQLHAGNPRLLAMSAGLRMLPDAGVWGFGPGTFGIVFPHYTHFLGDRIPGIWRYAHNDYLQTLLEWGWTGALAWSGLFFAGLRRCFASAFAAATDERERTLAFAAGVSLAGVALHAVIDFPLQIASLQLATVTLLGVAAATRGRYPDSAAR
jgi:O-antigen ligase